MISFDAVKHLVLCRIERRPPRLDLKIYPYLPQATVSDHLGPILPEPDGGSSVHERYAPGSAHPLLENTQIAHLFARV